MRVAGSDDFPFQRDDFHFDTVDGRNPAITTWDGAKTRCKQWDKRPSPQLVSRISEPINGMMFPDYYPVILGIVKIRPLIINIPMKRISIYVTISHQFSGDVLGAVGGLVLSPSFFPRLTCLGAGDGPWQMALWLLELGMEARKRQNKGPHLGSRYTKL